MAVAFGEFERVTRRDPCPVCEKPDWCAVKYDSARTPLVVLCKRVESDRVWGEAGYAHILQPGAQVGHGGASAQLDVLDPKALAALDARMARAHRRLSASPRLRELARDLGVGAGALLALGTGLDDGRLLFPMRNADGALIGIRVRAANGKKWCVDGSKNGLFMAPPVPHGGDLYLPEGATDTAALLSLGLTAVGRPSCDSGLRYLKPLVRAVRPARVVVVEDLDEAGIRGAAAAATELRVYARDVRVVAPPVGIKDVREWVRRGATRADVEQAAAVAARVDLEIDGGGR